ncbi:MAG: ATP-binding protein [Pseudomonadota bacterium]
MNSLRRAMTVRLIVGLTAVLLAAEGALFLFLRRQIVAAYDEGLLETVRFLASAVHVEKGGILDMELGDVPVPEFAAVAPTSYFQIWRNDTVIFRSASLGVRDLVRPSAPGSAPVVIDGPLPNARPGRGVTLEFAPTPELGVVAPPLELTLAVMRERETLDARLRDISLALAALGLALLLLMPLVVADAVRKGLARLLALGRDVDAIDVATLGQRLATSDLPVELAPIVERTNQLLERIQEGVTRERRFSDDVAHQLRTPIAELRVLADVALAGVKPGDTKHRQTFEDARAIAVQMEHLAIGLLAMARGESSPPLTQAEVDLRAVLLRVRADLEPRAMARGLRLKAPDHDGAPVVITTDPALLESVLDSVLDNALTYTPSGGEIELSVRADDRFARLTVTNSDLTLTDADLPRLFQRFWRKDQARRDGEHSGLGMAVALAMSRAIAGELTADRPSPTTVRFTLSLPVGNGPRFSGPTSHRGRLDRWSR